jgi:formylglycine-generating enzyme required for sulfatase activity
MITRRTLLRRAGISLALPLIDVMQDDAMQDDMQMVGLSAIIDGPGMVPIAAGEFLMGASGDVADVQPVHRVRISHGFEMGKFEVTQAQWETVMRNAHAKPGTETNTNPSDFKGASRPVDSVSWIDVQQFLARINARDEQHQYRLPTEAEWEYACRAGKDEPANVDSVAWYKENSNATTQPVGQKKPNAWGLYDMLGNVAEWVSDWYGNDYYAQSPATDPQGPESGSYRVFRGGAWFDPAKFCRASHRGFDFPIHRLYNVGFRLVRTAR